MKRTKYQKQYVLKIDALNDQLWYFLFATEELNNRLSNFSEAVKEAYTTDLFVKNPYASRIHIKANDLTNHQSKNLQLTFGAYFSNAYEILTNYIHDVFNLLKSTNSLPLQNWKDTPEVNISGLFTKNGLPALPQYILDTFNYLRLRRNHFTHIANEADSKLLDFISNSGHFLETKWKLTGVVSQIDFSRNTDLTTFSVQETIECFKLLRICLIELDEHIAIKLNKAAFILQLVTEHYGTKNAKKTALAIQERTNKIISIAKYEYGFSISEADCSADIQSIGFK